MNLTSGSNNIDIGNPGDAGEASTIRIGAAATQSATYIAGIRGVALGGLQPVGVTAQGRLGVKASSARFKEAIRPMGEESATILSLHPVTFRYKKEFDPSGGPQYRARGGAGCQSRSDLVYPDASGKPLTVRYDEVNAMLLNEFLKEHKAVEEQANKIQRLQGELREVTARLNAKGL